MWKVVKLENGDSWEYWDILCGTKEGARRLMARLKSKAEGMSSIQRDTGKIQGYSQGYYVVRWVEETTNEFGPISP